LLQLRERQTDPSQSVYLHRTTEKYWNIFKIKASFEHTFPVFARSVCLYRVGKEGEIIVRTGREGTEED